MDEKFKGFMLLVYSYLKNYFHGLQLWHGDFWHVIRLMRDNHETKNK